MKDEKSYLLHVLERIARIRDFTTGGYVVFEEDLLIQDAVLRNLEVIGEAIKQISPELRAQHPQIPWRRITGMRDVLIHDYMGVNLHEVWNVIQNNPDDLEAQIQAILSE
jgi:uncharacterized protein with HEPN domain